MFSHVVRSQSILQVARKVTSSWLKPQMVPAVAVMTPWATAIPAVTDQQVRFRSNRSRRGLYDGKDIRSGNNVSFSMKATKRKFKPNVFIKRVYSEIFNDMIPFHMTASALRSIDNAGGLDNYLLNNPKITEGEGYVIKKKLEKRLKNRARYARKQTEKMAAAAAPSDNN